MMGQINSDSTVSTSYMISFNQDFSSVTLGSQKGHVIFNLENLDNLEIVYEGREEIFILERLFSSSLIAFVSYQAPRKLQLRHIRKNEVLMNSSYSNTILAVRLNRKKLVVCLEESLLIHDIRNMAVLHTIADTPPNPKGVCALSTNTNNNDVYYLAYPGSNSIGEVQIFDALNLQAKVMIPAHNSPLAAMTFSSDGDLIATASEKGTVIRVFNVLSGAKIYEFRRGVKRCVSISSLNFSNCCQYLSLSSNTETVHVFKLEEQKIPIHCDEDSGWINYLSRAVTSASVSYLPTQVTDVFSQDRSFATAYLPVVEVKSVSMVTKRQGQLRLLVGTSQGILYVYNIDDNREATLYKEHNLYHYAEPELSKKRDKNESYDLGINTIPSYANIVKGNVTNKMTESDTIRELDDAASQPIDDDTVKLDDKQEFPEIGDF